ncbi:MULTISPECIES: haloacid dehalogenase type II [Sorangium]|uniref:haloacid dehalogenase type II n=1 Tax=Sorangium TaxID=39643 RepID=UPI003D9C502B
MSDIRAAIFDAYGTLLDVHAPVVAQSERIGPHWRRFSVDWRAKQLEYTWVRSLTGPVHHRDFWRCTEDALDWVSERHGLSDRGLRAALLDAYRACPAYPEVPAVLGALRARGLATAILSNGEPGMLAAAVTAAGIADLLDDMLSVEAIGVFKPHPLVYRLPERRFGHAAASMAFISANAWDTQGALACGYRAFRVNRAGDPDEYGLRGRAPELDDLAKLPALLSG